MSFKTYSFFLFVVLFLLTSCGRDSQVIVPLSESDIILAFDKVKNNSIKRDINFSPQWKDLVEFENNYYIPLKTDKKMFSYTDDIVRYSLSNKLWLKASKQDNHWTFTLLTILPTDINDNKKSGIIIYEDWTTGNKSYDGYIEKRLLRGYRYQKEINKVSGKIEKIAALNPPGEYCYYATYSTCVDLGGEETCTYKTEWICSSTTLPGTGSNDDPRPPTTGGNTGGSGGGNNTPPIIFDCAGVRYGRAEIGECGECIGGTTGINSCADIKNLIVNPCLKKMVNDILSKNLEFEAGKTLQSAFGINTSFNLTFTESTSLPNSTGGVAIGQQLSVNGDIEKLNVEIQLNVNTLQNASQEYIAMVIIHEAVHAHLYSKGIIGDPWPFGEHANAHHEIMWVNYISFISNYLVENFGTPLKDANSLAMEGLHRTMGSKLNDKIYLAINSKAKEPISDERARINTKYKLGQSGTKCNN